MRSPTCIVSTLRRWRLFSPWIVKPCSRVFRELSGELTIIQNWEARPSVRPDFRFRLGRPDLAGLSPAAAAGAAVSGVSEIGFSCTTVIVFLLRGRRRGPQLAWLRQQDGQVADLGQVRNLVARHKLAHFQQADVSCAWVFELAVPLRLAPAMEEIDRPPADAGEAFEALLQRPGGLLVVA